MLHQCALAKLSYLLSKDELSPAQVRQLIARPLRGELTQTSHAPTFSSPVNAEQRLQTLFTRIVQCATSTSHGHVSPPVRARTLSNTSFAPPALEALPAEFNPPWPATLKDEETAEKAILPYLLGQASAQPTDLLATLLDSLALSPLESAALAPNPIALLNDPSTTAQQTPLHLAVLAGQVANVKLLLAAGASVHSRDVLGHSALYYAARHGGAGLEMVNHLRAAGAHLGTVEIERGDVGLEVARTRKLRDEEGEKVWRLAAGEDALKRAQEVLKSFLEVDVEEK